MIFCLVLRCFSLRLGAKGQSIPLDIVIITYIEKKIKCFYSIFILEYMETLKNNINVFVHT